MSANAFGRHGLIAIRHPSEAARHDRFPTGVLFDFHELAVAVLALVRDLRLVGMAHAPVLGDVHDRLPD